MNEKNTMSAAPQKVSEELQNRLLDRAFAIVESLFDMEDDTAEGWSRSNFIDSCWESFVEVAENEYGFTKQKARAVWDGLLDELDILTTRHLGVSMVDGR